MPEHPPAPHRSVVAAARHQPWLAAAAAAAGVLALGGGALGAAVRLGALPAGLGDPAAIAAIAGATAAAGCVPAWWLGRARRRVAEAAAAAAIAPSASGLFAGGDHGAAALADDAERRLVARAGWPQAALGGGGAAAAIAAVWLLWPGTTAPAGGAAIGAGAALAVLAFPLLVLERRFAAADAADLPEAGAIARLLRLAVWCALGAGLASAAGGAGYAAAGWVAAAAAVFAAMIAGEILARSVAAPFLPVRDAGEARAVGDSAIAGVLLARLHPGDARSRVHRDGLKERFGIDLSQSWALGFVVRGLPWLAGGTLLGAWLLSGLSVVGVAERAIYERFGQPAAVWGPGLHVHLPWPLGGVRRLDFGQVRTTALSPAVADAERTYDRLWEVTHAGEVEFLVPGVSAQAPDLMACDARVLWRIGDADADALAWHARVGDADALIRRAAARRMALAFAQRPLAALLGADRDRLTGALTADLQAELDRLAGGRSGLDVLAVVVDAIHPPTAAAPAYHGVQAAGHLAAARVAAARGQAAHRIAGEQGAAAATLAAAAAGAGERTAAATAEAARFAALLEAQRAGGGLVERERWRQALAAHLKDARLVIVDHRLDLAPGPTIDLRRFAPPAGAKD